MHTVEKGWENIWNPFSQISLEFQDILLLVMRNWILEADYGDVEPRKPF